ncbi:MAG: ACT domain-containing protein, partial [Ilumatobacteraceae bacterium]
DHQLQSGDTCEVVTAKVETAGPSQDWLGFVASTRARNKIRQWFSRERRLDMIENGRERLVDEFRRESLPAQQIWKSEHFDAVMSELGYVDSDAFFAAVGESHVSARSVAQRIARRYRGGGDNDTEQLPATALRPRRLTAVPGHDAHGVHVEGLDDVLVRMSHCCTPVPGDDIIGFVTRGRGVSVHRADCANAVSLMSNQPTRLIEVDWDDERPATIFRVAVEVVAIDRSRLLRDVANAMSDHQVNIVASSTVTGEDRVAKMQFEFELADPKHLTAVMRTIKNIDSVYDAYRLVPGGGAAAKALADTAANAVFGADPGERAQPAG